MDRELSSPFSRREVKRWIVDRELSCFLKERGEDNGSLDRELSSPFSRREVKRWIVDRELSCFLKPRGEEVDRGQRVTSCFLKERGEEVDSLSREVHPESYLHLSQGER